MSQRTIFALLVGIDKYAPPVPPLDGCVNDMRAVRDHLKRRAQRNHLRLEMKVLENDQATRFNVVKQFEQHLTQATENDIVFFYFSGHGSQEKAHEVFWKIESDRKNETLVCYDSRTADGMDLADKEMATLLDMVAKKTPHMVVIYDCCNSGGGTRSLVSLREEEQKPPLFRARQTKMYGGGTQVRSLDSYILPRNMTATRSALGVDAVEDVIVPESRHVFLSAAASHELAKETFLGGSPRGVFTYSLIEVLEGAVGRLSYQDLMRRVRGLVLQRTYDQVPQLYAKISDDLDLAFLDGLTSLDNNYFLLSHNREQGWTIDGGAIHGLTSNEFGGDQTLLNVFAEDASESEMNGADMALGQVSVTKVDTYFSLVRAEGNLFLDTHTAYRTRLHSMAVKQLAICIRGEAAGVKAARQALTEDTLAGIYLREEADRNLCDYNLIATQATEFIITRKSDPDEAPLVEQIRGFGEKEAAKAIDNLERIAKWEQLLEMNNPTSSLPTNAIEVQLLHVDRDEPYLPGRKGIELTYDQPDAPPRFRIKLISRYHKPLYVSLVHLSSMFGVNPEFIPGGTARLEGGREMWIRDGAVLRGAVRDELASFGLCEIHETFKLLFSTVDFNATPLKQPDLSLPRPATRSSDKPRTNTRSLMFEDSGAGKKDDWNTNQLTVLIRREDARCKENRRPLEQ